MPPASNPAVPGLRSFGVLNYRCFDEETGFVLDNPRRINVIVGRNNAGKSSVLQAIRWFAQCCGVKDAFGTQSVSDTHHRNIRPIRATATVSYNFLENLHGGSSDWRFLVKQFANIKPEGVPVEFGGGEQYAKNVVGRMPTHFGSMSNSNLNIFLEKLSNSNSSPYSISDIQRYLYNGLASQSVAAAKAMLDNPLVIPVPRAIVPGSPVKNERKNISFSGAGVVEELARLERPSELGQAAKEARLSMQRLKSFLCELLDEKDLSFYVGHEAKEIVLNISGREFFLREFGTGLHHLMLMCTAFAILSNRTVFLEEPEIHLHPDIQRKFFRFLLTQTQNRYYISTHSTIFVDDMVHPDVAVYHVTHQDNRSRVERIVTSDSARGLLHDLGYKPSDLLMANGVIWIEGPSDRVFLRKWLELEDPELREGEHFVFNWFGGSALTHLGFTDETGLVPALRLNRNTFLVVDRDAQKGQQPEKEFVRRVEKELGSSCWVSQGWEIENYVRSERVRDTYSGLVPSDFTVSESAKLKGQIDSKRKGNIDLEKLSMARALTAGMTDVDLDCLDLRERVQQLAQLIRKWNHLPQKN